MDVLVSMGTNASYIYSLISILHHHVMVRLQGCSCGPVEVAAEGTLGAHGPESLAPRPPRTPAYSPCPRSATT